MLWNQWGLVNNKWEIHIDLSTEGGRQRSRVGVWERCDAFWKQVTLFLVGSWESGVLSVYNDVSFSDPLPLAQLCASNGASFSTIVVTPLRLYEIRILPSNKMDKWIELNRHVQWIGLRENLQETMVFTIKYRGFRLKFSHHPILWHVDALFFAGTFWSWWTLVNSKTSGAHQYSKHFFLHHQRRRDSTFLAYEYYEPNTLGKQN